LKIFKKAKAPKSKKKYLKTYYQKNKSKFILKAKKRYEENKEKHIKNVKERYKKKRDEILEKMKKKYKTDENYRKKIIDYNKDKARLKKQNKVESTN
jgi:hypothetical protein